MVQSSKQQRAATAGGFGLQADGAARMYVGLLYAQKCETLCVEKGENFLKRVDEMLHVECAQCECMCLRFHHGWQGPCACVLAARFCCNIWMVVFVNVRISPGVWRGVGLGVSAMAWRRWIMARRRLASGLDMRAWQGLARMVRTFCLLFLQSLPHAFCLQSRCRHPQ